MRALNQHPMWYSLTSIGKVKKLNVIIQGRLVTPMHAVSFMRDMVEYPKRTKGHLSCSD